MPIVIPPAGTSSASFFTPVEFADPAKPPAILGDDINPATGELRSILSGIHPVDSAVITRARTLRGSGVSVQSVGHRFDRVKKIDESFQTSMQYEADQVFADLVERGDITIPLVVISEESDAGSVEIHYTNLRTGKNKKA